MPHRKIRVACMGAGWVAQHRHLPSMREHGGFEVAAVADTRGERAEALASRFGVPRHFEASAVSQLPVVDEIDAVICATPPRAHADVIADALQAGKHVLGDKPLAVGADACERLTALAAERGVALCTAMNFQFARSATTARKAIDKGRLGQVRGVWAIQLSNPERRLPEWYDDLPLGLFYDESPNLIGLATTFAPGELDPVGVSVVPSTMGRRSTPAQVSAQLLAGGVPVSIQMSFEAPLSEWHVLVLGERGFAAVDLFRDIAVLGPNDGRHGAAEVARTSLAATLSHWGGYARSGIGHLSGRLRYGSDEVYRRFHTAALGGDADGIAGSDAVAIARIQDWIVRSARDRPAPDVAL